MRRLSIMIAAFALSTGIVRADDFKTVVQDIIKHQIDAFRKDDGETAYSFAAPGIRSIYPEPGRFMEMVKSHYAPIYRPGNLTFGRNVSEDEGRLVVQELLITDREGKSWQAVYVLARQDDGSYRITGVRLKPITDSAI